jgi:hypothetical protein
MNIAAPHEPPPSKITVVDKEGWNRFQQKLEEEKVSQMIDKNSIKTSYTKWNEKILEIRKKCSKKVKLVKKWKVCRKITAAKKRVTSELKTALSKENVNELKERRNLLKKSIELKKKKG